MSGLKRWTIDAGNSNEGCVGFVLRDIRATTAEEALRIVRETYMLPESIEDYRTEDDHGHRGTLCVYFNAARLTLEDVYEDEDAPEDEADEADEGGAA